jgi:hypothetical protein
MVLTRIHVKNSLKIWIGQPKVWRIEILSQTEKP